MKHKSHNIRFFLFTAIFSFLFIGSSYGQFKRVPPKWEKKLKLKDHFLNEMIENEYGDIVSVGYLQSGVRKKKDFLLMTFDADGETKSIKMIGGTGNEEAYALDMHYDGYYIGGYSNSSWKGSIDKNDGWLTKVSKEGNPMWYKVLGGQEDDAIRDLLTAVDGIYTCGYEGDKGVIYKISDDGEVLWKIEAEDSGSSFEKLVFISPNEIVAVGSTGKERESKLFVQAFSSTGSSLWTVRGKEKGIIPKDAILDEDRGIMITGIGEVKRKRQEAFVSLIKDQELTATKFYGGRYNDGAERILRWNRSTFWLFGYTRSHERNARRSDACVIPLNNNLRNSGKNIRHFGSKFEERITDVLVTATGDLYVTIYFEGVFRKRNQLLQLDYDKFRTGSKGLSPFKLQEINYVDGDNAIFSKSDDGYIKVLLSEEANKSQFPLWVDIKSNEPNLDVPKRFIFKKSNQDVDGSYRIPVKAKAEIENKQVQLEISLHDREHKKTPYDKQIYTLPTEQSAFVEIDLLDYNVKKEGDQYVLDVELINMGTIASEPITAKILSDALNVDKDELGENIVIAAEETMVISYPFTLNNKYSETKITADLNCFKADFAELGNFEMSLDLSDIIESEEKDFTNVNEKIDVPTDPQESAINANFMWVSPDIDDTGLNFKYEKSTLKLKIKFISNQYFEPQNFTVLLNGQPAIVGEHFMEEDEQLDSNPSGNGDVRYTYKNKLMVPLGESQISIQLQKDGAIVSTETLTVNHDPPRADLHLYSIGIPAEDLEFTTKDAQDFVDLYTKQQGRLFDQVNITLNNTSEATNKYALEKLFGTIRIDFMHKEKIKPNDVVIVYLSGHGFRSEFDSDNFRIQASDFDNYYEELTSLDFQNEIYKQLSRVKCKKIIFMDACQSGALTSSLEETENLEGDEDPLGFKTATLSEAIYSLASAENSFTFILSSQDNEQSYEDRTWNNSAFMKGIKEAFANELVKVKDGSKMTADLDENKVVYLSELQEFLAYRVPHLVENKPNKTATSQTPFVPPSSLKEDKPIYNIIEE